MTWYLVTWVAWACPGGWLGGPIERAPRLRPHVCQEGAESRAFSGRADAERLVSDLGQDARPRLWQYRGLRREELPVTFKP